MKIDELPPDTKENLETLVRVLTAELAKNTDSPHLKAVNQSSMPGGGVLAGSNVSAPDNPQFDVDDGELSTLHRRLLESGGEVLYGVILHADRPDTEAAWVITPKLVSRAEYAALVAKRSPIDEKVAEILAEHAGKEPLEYIRYGRSDRGEPSVLAKKPKTTKRVVLPNDPRLDELMRRAEKVYRDAGLEPLIIIWSRRGKSTDVRDYFE